jgi:hypothetical protein
MGYAFRLGNIGNVQRPAIRIFRHYKKGAQRIFGFTSPTIPEERRCRPSHGKRPARTNSTREPRLLPWLMVRKNVGIGLELHLETVD